MAEYAHIDALLFSYRQWLARCRTFLYISLGLPLRAVLYKVTPMELISFVRRRLTFDLSIYWMKTAIIFADKNVIMNSLLCAYFSVFLVETKITREFYANTCGLMNYWIIKWVYLCEANQLLAQPKSRYWLLANRELGKFLRASRRIVLGGSFRRSSSVLTPQASWSFPITDTEFWS